MRVRIVSSHSDYGQISYGTSLCVCHTLIPFDNRYHDECIEKDENGEYFALLSYLRRSEHGPFSIGLAMKAVALLTLRQHHQHP